MFGEVFLKELAGFGRYEAVEVELLDLLSVFLSQSLLFIDRFEMIHDAAKKDVHVWYRSTVISSSVDLERPIIISGPL
jgi:hypothetical protein